MNHGYLEREEEPEDYIVGASGIEHIVRLPDGNWSNFLPADELQRKGGVETMSCVSFGATSAIEMQINLLLNSGMLTSRAREFLSAYMIDGKVNFSDKYTAIKSETRPTGNYLTKVAQTIREVGLIPESMLPFGNPESWGEYHNAAQITAEMDALGQQFLELFVIQYEWVLTPNSSAGKTFDENGATRMHHLKQAPLLIASHGHCTDFYFAIHKQKYGQYDSYSPFRKEKNWKYHVPYTMKILITEKSEFTEAEMTEARRFALELVSGKPSRIGFRHEAAGEAYRIEEDGSLKYKRGVPCPLFTSLCADGTVWGINEETWERLRAGLIK